MDYYIDIQVLPDLDISAPALMNNLFAKFHRSSAHSFPGQIAVSFPNYSRSLGDVLRLHGSFSSLNQFMALPWLKGLRDYTLVGEVGVVPDDIKGYRNVYRVQKKSVDNRRKRSVKKGWLSEEEAIHRIPDKAQPKLTLPYLQIKSLSSQQCMRIYVALGDIVPDPAIGTLNSYGLSKTATVPWF